MSDLKSLAIQYVTDKEITYGHDYIPGYIDLFDAKRHAVKNMLEIGIGLGEHYDAMRANFPNYTIAGGLKMWRDYFSEAEIYGMDIYECDIDEPRITTIVGDQGNEADLLGIVDKMGGSIDVIIDDGSHCAEHQVFSFTVLCKFMKAGGIYVIEDVQPEYILGFMSLSVFPAEFQEYIRENFEYKWYDTRGQDRPVDDFLMVFLKK